MRPLRAGSLSMAAMKAAMSLCQSACEPVWKRYLMRKCFMSPPAKQLGTKGALSQVWTKMIPRVHEQAPAPMPRRRLPEDDRRQVQAPHRLGSAGRAAALWRDPRRIAARCCRHGGDRTTRAQPRAEGAHRVRADRAQG